MITSAEWRVRIVTASLPIEKFRGRIVVPCAHWTITYFLLLNWDKCGIKAPEGLEFKPFGTFFGLFEYAGGGEDIADELEPGQRPLNLGSDRDWKFVAQPKLSFQSQIAHVLAQMFAGLSIAGWASWLFAQQPPSKYGLHIAPSIGNQTNDNVMIRNSINHTIWFERGLP